MNTCQNKSTVPGEKAGSDRESPNESHKVPSVSFFLKAQQLFRFFQVLQRGFVVQARVGCTIKSLLCQQLGVSAEYLEERIQTIFLDGKAVDNLESATISDESTLALSAAMPGLVGATFRRGGFYAAMRSQIQYCEEAKQVKGEDGKFTLKLFNLLIKELGPVFLQRGIWVDSKVFENFLRHQPEDFWKACITIKLDGTEVEKPSLLEKQWNEQGNLVHLSVVVAGEKV